MRPKPLLLRRLGRFDIEAAADHYKAEAGAELAFRFLASVEASFRSIRERPRTGSPRYGEALDLTGLRARSVTRFPYLIFYLEREDHIEVWRVLHARSDVPARFREPQI